MTPRAENTRVEQFPSVGDALLLVCLLLLASAVDHGRSVTIILFLSLGLAGIVSFLVFPTSITDANFSSDSSKGGVIVASGAAIVLLGGPGARSAYVGDLVLSHLLPWGLTLLALVVVGKRLAGRWRIAALVVILVVSLVISAWTISSSPLLDHDVWHLHEQAAGKLADGRSPYSGLMVADTSPGPASGSLIEGYPYPPLTAVLYAGGSLVGGDSRWMSVVAWLAFLAIVYVLASHNRTMGTSAVLLVVMIGAAQPGWPFVLALAWTEPVSLMFLTLSLVCWEDRPALSGVLLGLAFATKQYFLLGGVVLILSRVSARRKRVVAAGSTVLVTLLPILFIDASGFWNWAVRTLWTLPPRSDSTNLTGLIDALGMEWAIPRWVPIAVPVALTLILAPKLRTAPQFVLGLAVAIGSSFFLGPQAFANYWFLVAGMVLLALAVNQETDVPQVASLPPEGA